jgi:hypothetical protein
MHRKKIDKLAKKLARKAGGSAHYLGYYKKALKRVERKLSEDKRQEYEAMAKDWTEKPLPPRLQQRYVHSHDSNRSGLTSCFAALV